VAGAPSLWEALRHNPTRASEVGVLYALPQLAPHVRYWWSKQSDSTRNDDPKRAARRVLRRSTGVARRGGLITGSSFYVGMIPAIAMLYCEQLVVVLRIAAVYGREPGDPLRAAEILVIQGRYATLDEAAAALERVQRPGSTRSAGAGTAFRALQELPSMIGLRLRRVNWRNPIDVLVTGAEIASYLVPVISLPVWAYASARAMRRVGRSAIEFYGAAPHERPSLTVVLPPRPSPRTRTLLIGSMVPLGIVLGVLFYWFPFGPGHTALRLIGLAIGELALVLTSARLIRLTRVPAASAG
jgi:hypothetical protein